MLSEEKIMEVVREASRGSATRRDGSTSVRIARAIEAAVLEAQPTDQRLLNLLCRIHRDGGHYIAEHGVDKAVEAADMRVAEQNAALDAQVKQEPVAYGLLWNAEGKEVLQFPVCANEEEAKSDLRMYSEEDQSAITIRPLYAAPVVQPDMVMVPREATHEMVSAGYSKITMEIENSSRDISDVYRAMIAAAEGNESK